MFCNPVQLLSTGLGGVGARAPIHNCSCAQSSIPPSSTPVPSPPPRQRLRFHRRRPCFANRQIQRIQMEAAPKKSNPADSLTVNLLVEILRRLPVRSLCRFKCVSRSWYRLISNPHHRMPQTLAGFFYHSFNGERFPRRAHHFTNVTGKGVPFIYPSFSFLPVPSKDVVLRDSCNGLLLCTCYEPSPNDGNNFHYVVCNPATKKWLMFPGGNWDADCVRTARLGFDPTVSSHFHVIECVVDPSDDCVIGVKIYSSKTATWNFKESQSKWGDGVMLDDTSRSVFLNGFMHMLTYASGIIVVDMEGKIWRKIPMRGADLSGGSIHQTQGRLCLLNVDIHNPSNLSIWILEDHGSNKWTLKHTVSTMRLFRQKNIQFDGPGGYNVIAVHPECNLIFFVYGWDQTLMAYEVDRKVRVIRKLGRDCSGPYLPYVPLFLEQLAE
ncbi:putative F-box protein At3g10240 isoform X1 [Sorghum bicolor]|nr:putative F-box protein At3g10240 isoform X1 [Sorghum bicolor]|eukprot:XP_002467641.2 putative F-box protein At3g10240 isoform X1 [Sorghum bicolor]